MPDDYKARVAKEYHDLESRFNKLTKALDAYDSGSSSFVPMDIDLLRIQASAMETYLKVLRLRSVQESIEL